jgi:hypothetical protein
MTPSLPELAQRFLVRALTANFQRERAADDERAQLAAHQPKVADPLAQDYVAWRRAALWIAGVALSISVAIAILERQPAAEQFAVLFASANQQTLEGEELQRQAAQLAPQIGEGNLAILDGLGDFLLFVKLMVAVLVFLAAKWWMRLRRSRALARWAWLSALVLPLLVSSWPWAQSLDFSQLEAGTGINAAQLKQWVATLLAGGLVLTVAPKLIALFPGIVRSTMALKTLLPEAAAPGWLTVVFAPFLAGFLLLVLSFMSQVQGSWVLICGVLALSIGPVLYVRNAAALVRPLSAAEVDPVIGAVRGKTMVSNAIGVGLLVWYLIDLDSVSWLMAFHLLLDAAGGILLTMVAISDVTLALLAFSHRQSASFQSSELRTSYEQRLQSLAGAGLTDVDAALGVNDLDDLRRVSRGGA